MSKIIIHLFSFRQKITKTSPASADCSFNVHDKHARYNLEVKGLEPLTCGLQSHRSSQLSYTPEILKPFTSRSHSLLT
jgi:hypothetical protein